MSFFEIDTDLIQSLNDELARELIARLCRAELRSQRLSEACVTWGGDQRAKDGGVDVRVECPDPLSEPGYIPRPETAIQVKAEKFPPSKVSGEVAPNGVLRPAIIDLDGVGGAFVIASTKDRVSDSARTKRIDAMRNTIVAGGYGGVALDFYDARRIADWVEQYPAIGTWLRQVTGTPLSGWQPYGPWAYRETEADADFILDDKPRIRAPGVNHSLDSLGAIDHIRSKLLAPVSIRVVGLSGVGKTRLVQALFDARIETPTPAPSPDSIIYTDVSDDPHPSPRELVDQLSGRGFSTTIIVDNCSSNLHDRLTEIVKRTDNKTRLITVEYDIRDDLPEGTWSVNVEGASDATIKSLVHRKYPTLSDLDAARITEFSDGNARVACALASTAESSGELAKLRDAELFERLFHQRNEVDVELLRAAQAAALVYSFDGENHDESSELATLAEFAQINPITLYGHLATLKQRGLLQSRGRWRAVLPHAIANRLASAAIQSVPRDFLLARLLTDASDRLARSFSRRIGYLHDLAEVQEIAHSLLNGTGRLADLKSLTGIDVELFSNIAPVNQERTLAATERAASDPEFLSCDNTNRHTFLRIIRGLAYEAETFDRAVQLLLRFTLAEPDGHNHDPARSKLTSLFQILLSGTLARADQRGAFVEMLCTHEDERHRSIGFECLSSALEATHFSSMESFEFGARARTFGWEPASNEEAKDWFHYWVSLAGELGAQDNANGKRARELLGSRLRGIWSTGGVDELLVSVGRRLAAVDGWPDGWLGVRRVLQWDRQDLPPDSLTRLQELEQALAPSDLVSEIRAKVLTGGLSSYDIEELEEVDDNNASRHGRARGAAAELGRRAASDFGLVTAFLPDLLKKSQNPYVYSFAKGLAEATDQNALILGLAQSFLRGTNEEVNLIGLRGIVSGWHSQDPEAVQAFLDSALTDEVWLPWFVELQCQLDLDDRAFERLLEAIADERCPTWQFRYLSLGRATEPLSVDQAVQLVRELLDRPDHGFEVAFDLLNMIIHGTDRQAEQYKSDLAHASLSVLQSINWSQSLSRNARLTHEIGEVFEFVLSQTEDEQQVVELLRNVVPKTSLDAQRAGEGHQAALKPFFRHFPQLALNEVCQPDDDGSYQIALHRISNAFSARAGNALSDVDSEILIEWCGEDPDGRFPFAAKACSLFVKTNNDDAPTTIHDTAKRVLAAAPDKSLVLQEFEHRLHPSSGWSSLASALESRLSLLPQLNPEDDPEITALLTKLNSRVRTQIENERERERREEASQNASFE